MSTGAGHMQVAWGLGTRLLLKALRRIYNPGQLGAKRLPVPSAMVQVRKAKPPSGQGRDGAQAWSSVRQQGTQGVKLRQTEPTLRSSRLCKRLGACPSPHPGPGKRREQTSWGSPVSTLRGSNPLLADCVWGQGLHRSAADQSVCVSRRAINTRA